MRCTWNAPNPQPGDDVDVFPALARNMSVFTGYPTPSSSTYPYSLNRSSPGDVILDQSTEQVILGGGVGGGGYSYISYMDL